MAENSGSDQVNGSGSPAPPAASAPNSTSAVFISYASQDAAIADALCAALESAGIACWIAPRNVRPGDFYADAIVNAINACPVLVLLLSKNSVDSAHVLREVERASAKKRPVIAFRIDTIPLPPGLEYFLSASQWIDASSGTPERGFPKLVEALRDRSSSTPKAEAGRPTVQPPGKRNLKRIVFAAAAVLAAALLFLVIDKLWLSKRATTEPAAIPTTSGPAGATAAVPAISDKSIAVLPFTDMSEKKDQEYFADGMAEEILDLLAKIPGLSVVGRTSSFQFKGKNDDLRTIGTKLNAAYLLEGSVRKSGERLRVTAQLIESQTGTQKWSDTYERDMSDVLKLQDSIAAGIARALQVTIGVDSYSVRAPINTEAYNLYLRGRNAMDGQDQAGLEAATGYFEQALDLDPSFAAASAYLAETRHSQVLVGFVAVRDALDRAREESNLAARLDPRLAVPHAVLGAIALFDWDWAGAEAEVTQALKLEPHNSMALYVGAVLASQLGKTDQAVRLARAEIAADPLRPNAHLLMGLVLFWAGRTAEAEASLEEALQISPTYYDAQYELALVLLPRGKLEKSLHVTESLPEGDQEIGGKLVASAAIYSAMGQKLKSDAALATLKRLRADTWAFGIASVYALRGERDQAFPWLDKAIQQRNTDLAGINLEPGVRNLRDDPRYKAILRKMNVPE